MELKETVNVIILELDKRYTQWRNGVIKSDYPHSEIISVVDKTHTMVLNYIKGVLLTNEPNMLGIIESNRLQ